MKQENRDFLDANRHYHTVLVQAGIIKHLDGNTTERLLSIIREEFAPNYMGSTWCSSCVVDILKFAYTQYDKYLAEINIIMNGDLSTAQPLTGILSLIESGVSTKDIVIDQLNAKQTKKKRRNQSK